MLRVVALGLGLLASLALVGCGNSDNRTTLYDAPKPLDKMSTEEWCAYYTNFLSNPQLSAKDRAMDIQRMKARGCAAPAS